MIINQNHINAGLMNFEYSCKESLKRLMENFCLLEEAADNGYIGAIEIRQDVIEAIQKLPEEQYQSIEGYYILKRAEAIPEISDDVLHHIQKTLIG